MQSGSLLPIPETARRLLALGPADSGGHVTVPPEGFGWSSLHHFLARSGAPRREIVRYLRLSPVQLARRRRAGRLGLEESGRLLQLAELYADALAVFEDHSAAMRWLTAPAFGLGGDRPIDYAATDAGTREVRDLLGRIEHGVFS